jgi:TolB-like protein/tetratricopeptide (TPR) repeat protein
MTPESSAKLVALFDRAISSAPEIRSAILAELSATDPELARELASLLSAHDTADDFFEKLSRDIIVPAVAAVGLDEGKSDPALLGRLKAAVAPTYEIEGELGGGGMSRVFVATETRLARKVVIKVLPPEMSLDVSVERFRREIRLSALLQHPHIVHVLASDAADGLLYYVMPYVEGETLRARISRDGALPLGDALAIWRDVLDALGFAHQHGVVHRDVKPENILLSGRNALVADFGIARAIEAAAELGADKHVSAAQGVVLGTPLYMAPEQVTGEGEADQRIDIYAAGLVMYEMLSGRSPFAGLSKRETVLAQVSQSAPPLTRSDVPPGLAALVLRCLEKNPEARPQSAETIWQQLENGVAAGGPRISRPRKYATLAAVILIASILFAGAGYVARQGASSPSAGDLAIPENSDARPSLAVLPLTNRSADPADAELADGMTEELIGTLAKNPDLRVIASTSAFALKGAQRDVRQIAESLHVSNILEGSLQKIGPRLRMQVRLVGTGDGSTKWSEVYDREMNDLFAIREEIARAVAGELNVQLRKGVQPRPNARRYTPNVVAYESYVRGMDVALMRTNAGTRRAMAHFERAIAADSNFAAAHAGLVRTYLQLGNATKLRDRRQWVARAETTALKAVALDDSLAEAHSALGWVRLVENDHSAAEAELKKAIALNPSAPRVHEGLARLYMMTSRPAEQLVQARLGMESDPFSHSAIREMALALNMNGRCDEALELLKPLKSLSPPAGVAWIISGQCYASQEKWPEAIAEYRWNIDNATGASGPAFLAHALARAGREEEARRILADLLAGRKDSHGAFGIGVVYAGLRDYDRAFLWLNRAADEGSITAYIAEPMFADLHRDRRYGSLRQRMRFQKR